MRKYRNRAILPFLLALLILLLSGCTTAQWDSNPISNKLTNDDQPAISPYDAQSMLEKIQISPVTYAPNPSCGIVLPSELPIEHFRISVIGTTKETGSSIDLFEGKKVELDRWIVFDELDRYESVMLTVEIICEEQIIASREADLLSVK